MQIMQFMQALHLLHTELLIRASIGYFNIDILKISFKIEVERVIVLNEILDFSIEI